MAAFSTLRSATRQTSPLHNDPNPNWSDRPPKETLLAGCDFEHWLVVMEKPEGDPTRDEIIDSYIKTLAHVVGSEDEARKKIYSVSTRYYYAFGALVSEELSDGIKGLPRVRWVLPDSYLDVKNRDYGGEPFINGQAVPYDPRYHEEWLRNNAQANARNRRSDRCRNFHRSRNFEGREPNMEGGLLNIGGGLPSMGGPTNMGAQPNNPGGTQQPYTGGMLQQQSHMGGPSAYDGGAPSNMCNYQLNMGGVPNNAPNHQYVDGLNTEGIPYHAGPGQNQNSYAPNASSGPNQRSYGPNMGAGPGQN